SALERRPLLIKSIVANTAYGEFCVRELLKLQQADEDSRIRSKDGKFNQPANCKNPHIASGWTEFKSEFKSAWLSGFLR
ncbi:MAG TPA: hypothetical protein V6C88_05850, partial [Chroococcidiopsis sp.]